MAQAPNTPRPTTEAAAQEKKSGVNTSLIIAGISALAVLIFVLQNSQDVEVKFLFLDVTMKLWVLMLILWVLGWAFGGALWRLIKPGKDEKDAKAKR